MLYFIIDPNNIDILGSEDIEPDIYNTQENSLLNGKPFLTPVTLIDPAYDFQTQIKEDPIDTWDGTTATREYIVRDKTAEEVKSTQLEQDLAVIRDVGKDITLILIELVDYLLINTAMSPTDFTPDVKQAYLDVKVIADRIKANST